MIVYVLSLLCLFQAAHGLTVTVPPKNVSVSVGSDATIPCTVTNVQLSEKVTWKAPNGSVITDDDKVGDKNKYRIDGTYNLTILKTTPSDSGAYTCLAASYSLVGYLTVNGGSTAAFNALWLCLFAVGALWAGQSGRVSS